MGFQKFNKVEDVAVVSPQGQQAIADELKKFGKTSAAELTDEERKQVDLDKR